MRLFVVGISKQLKGEEMFVIHAPRNLGTLKTPSTAALCAPLGLENSFIYPMRGETRVRLKRAEASKTSGCSSY